MSEISEERMEEIRNMLLDADEDGLGELRLWLFKESCRIESRERQIDEMKGRLERERETLIQEHNQQLAKLERERESLWEKDDLAEQKLEMLLRAFFNRLHGYHVQYNIVSRETLLDAQAHPEKHKDLIVRVAGYSAFFNVLSRKTQDDIIGRTEQSL